MKILPETIARIKQIVDAESVISYLGFHVVRRTPKELRGPCKLHGGDNPTAFRLNLETKTWCCYTKHCEADGDRDLIGLVQRATGQSFADSVKFLADLAGVDLNNQQVLSEEFVKLRQQQEILKEIRRVKSNSSVTSFFPEEALEDFRNKRSSYFSDRGFPDDLLDFYEIGGTIDKYGDHRDTIPIRDVDGNLLTVSARRIDSDEDPKYLLLENIPKGSTLYNLNIAKHYLGLPRTLILVEGFVDVWNLALHGVYNVAAIMGTDLTPLQVRLIRVFAEEVIIALDPDDAGRKGTERVVKALQLGAQIKVLELPDGKDPKSLDPVDVKKYFGGYVCHE